MQPVLRAAIVGTGAVAHLHARAIAEDPRADLVAIANRNAQRRDAFADAWSVPDHAALLAAERPDLVVLCTPPDLHLRQAVDAFAAGADVLCEKPPALSLAELDAIQSAADAAGRRFAVVFQQRTGTAATHVRELLASGALGRPLVAVCHTLWSRGRDYYAVDWRGTWAGEGGGTTLGHGIHQLDLLAYLLGDWAEVDARLWRVDRDIEMEDVSTAVVRFASGAVATAVSSVLSPRQVSAIRIDAERATIELEHLYGHRGADWRITPANGVPAEVAAGWAFPAVDEPSGHGAVVRVVVDAMVGGDPLPAVVTGARRPLELVSAVYASATRGVPVTPAALAADDRFQRALVAEVADTRLARRGVASVTIHPQCPDMSGIHREGRH